MRDRIIYSYKLEKLYSKFNSNIHKLLTYIAMFCLVCLMCFYNLSFVIATWLALISIVVFRFDEKAIKAKAQMQNYQKLINIMDDYSDDELKRQLTELEYNDSFALFALEKPAMLATLKYLNEPIESHEKLTKFEKFVAFIAGA